MNWDAIGAIAELAGAMGVIASLTIWRGRFGRATQLTGLFSPTSTTIARFDCMRLEARGSLRATET